MFFRANHDPRKLSVSYNRIVHIFGLMLAIALAVIAILLGLIRHARQRPTEFSLTPLTAPAVTAGTLEYGMRFYGTLEISEHAGSGVLSEGDYSVWGAILGLPECPYFELYQTSDIENATTALLSFRIELYPDRMLPLIDDEDAWIFTKYLDAQDARFFTLSLTGGRLSTVYLYDDGVEACKLRLSLYPEL